MQSTTEGKFVVEDYDVVWFYPFCSDVRIRIGTLREPCLERMMDDYSDPVSYDKGYRDGCEDGYNDGYKQGCDDGYEYGYRDGLDDTHA